MTKWRSYWVSFIPLGDVPNVQPPFIKGQRDGKWVSARSEAHAAEKIHYEIDLCFGIKIEKVEVSN